MAITPFGFLALIFAIFLIYPTIKFYQNYQKTKIVDFLIFSLFCFFSIMTVIGVILRNTQGDKLFSWQFHGFMVFTAYLLIYLHARNVSGRENMRLLDVIMFIWYAFMILLIPFYELIPNQPDKAKFLIWNNFPRSYNNDAPKGAGVVLSNRTYIFSQNFQVLGDLFRLLACIIVFVIYLRFDPVSDSEELKKAKRYFTLAWFIAILYMLNLFPVLYKLSPLPPSIFLIGFVLLVALILLKYPLSVLLSKPQVLNASYLYKKIQSTESQDRQGLKKYIDYIEYLKSKDILKDSS